RPPDTIDEDRRVLLKNSRLSRLALQVRIPLENIFGVDEGQPIWKVGILLRLEPREEFQCERLGSLQNFPNAFDRFGQKVQVALASTDCLFPIPLIDIGAVIVIEKVIFAHRTHIRAQSFTYFHTELLQCNSLPLGCRLYDLRADGMLVLWSFEI